MTMTTTNTNQPRSAITIRRVDANDQAALARLAQLDSHTTLEGAVLGAEVEGRLLAAISIDTGEVIADPFSRTSELRAMLKLRVAQLERRHVGRRRASRLFGHRARPAIGGSPAGQVATLQRVV
jgi:hypothetical protein